MAHRFLYVVSNLVLVESVKSSLGISSCSVGSHWLCGLSISLLGLKAGARQDFKFRPLKYRAADIRMAQLEIEASEVRGGDSEAVA